MAVLRTHQATIDGIAAQMVEGLTDVRDILAIVTPGGGKSLLPVLTAARLIRAGLVDRVCWIVPRDTLKLQAEEAFADPVWRERLGHNLSVRAADNEPDPCRSGQGYVTTFQAIAAAPLLHLTQFRRHRYLICVDELHHLPGISDQDPFSPAEDDTAWSRAIAPLLETSAVRLLMSGTLERVDGRSILGLPYKGQTGTPAQKRWRAIDLRADGWAVVGYSRRQALAERAILPVTFGAVDGTAEWRPKREGAAPAPVGPVPISSDPELARYALYTAFRTGFADAMLRRTFDDLRAKRAAWRAEVGGDDPSPPGLGKMLVVASDQNVARRYQSLIASWLPARDAARSVRLAISDVRNAPEVIASFRLAPEPSILVTVGMAYEGLDCPAITHVACLTHIRSQPWLEQMVARATRVDPRAGHWSRQRAVVFHPDDIMFRRFKNRMETEQGTRARYRQDGQRDLFEEEAGPGGDEDRDWGLGIEPLRSEETGYRSHTIRPGPDFGAAAPLPEGLQPSVASTPVSRIERELRARLGQLVAGQVVEDASDGSTAATAGYHAYNAVLKSALGGKARSQMSVEELEAAIAWMERNRLADHLHLLEDDARFRWSSVRQGRASTRHGSGRALERQHGVREPRGNVARERRG